MKSQSGNLIIERAQPWLGTLVTMHVGGLPDSAAHRAIDAAFEQVAAVHRLMSFHAGSTCRQIAFPWQCIRGHAMFYVGRFIFLRSPTAVLTFLSEQSWLIGNSCQLRPVRCGARKARGGTSNSVRMAGSDFIILYGSIWAALLKDMLSTVPQSACARTARTSPPSMPAATSA